MKIAISLPDTLFQEAESVARARGISRSQLYSEALARYLAERSALSVSERLDAVYEAQPAAVDPALMAAQLQAVDDEAW